MTTGQNWIDATRRNLLGTFTEQFNVVQSDYAPGDGQITLSKDMSAIVPGTILSAGLNIFYVWSVNNSTATVTAGFNGSVDVAVTAGTLVRINPKFTDWDIWQELNNEILSLSSEGLPAYLSSDLTYNPTYTGYDLGTSAAANLLDVYEVKYLTPGPRKDMPRLPRTAWRLTRNAATSDIPSGLSIQLIDPSQWNVAGYLVRVVWQSILTPPATPSSDVSSVGLQPSAYDIPPIGTAIRLMAGREIPRNFIQDQGDTRRALEVTPGAIMQSANALKMLRQSLIQDERARLAKMYPLTMD